MADSDILVAGLTVAGGLKQFVLKWTSSGGSPLPYMALEAFEIWASATNNRAAATKIGESSTTQFTWSPVNDSLTRYFWVRARDRSLPSGLGNTGDWFPLSATAGIVATTQPTPVTISDVEEIVADLETSLGLLTASGKIRLRQVINPAANEFDSSIHFEVAGKAAGSPFRYSGLELQADEDAAGVSIRGDYFRFKRPDGTTVIAFDSAGRLQAGFLDVGIINAKELFIGGVGVPTDLIKLNAVSEIDAFTNDGDVTTPAGASGLTQIVSGAKVIYPGTGVFINFSSLLRRNGGDATPSFGLYRNGISVGGMLGNFIFATGGNSTKRFGTSGMFIDLTSVAVPTTVTYSLRARGSFGVAFPSIIASYNRMQIGAFKR